MPDDLVTQDPDAAPGGEADCAAGLPAPDPKRLSVCIDFELGHVRLSLAQLRRMAPGVVLQIEGASPGHISIVSAGCALGTGEVVDVNGRLGIRILQWSRT